MKSIYRYEVPIDGEKHTIKMNGDTEITKIACVHEHNSWYIEFWAENYSQSELVPRTFQVYGTGHRIPQYGIDKTDLDTEFRGTAERLNGLVFHLYEFVPYKIQGW